MSWIFVKTAASTTPWTPSGLSGLRFWLDAEAGVYDADSGGNLITSSGTAVRRWQDQSGTLSVQLTVSSANASSAPTWEDAVLNGKPVVRFRDETHGSPVGCGLAAGGTNIYSTNPTRIATFVVFKRNTQHNGTSGFGPATLVGVQNYAPLLAMPSASNPTHQRNLYAFWSYNGINNSQGEYAGGWDSQPLISPGEWVIGCHYTKWENVANGFQQIIRVDGGAHTNTSLQYTPNAEIGTANQNLFIGARYVPTTETFDGDIAEVLMVTGDDWDTSTATRDKIEGYLAHKWGLAANLPAGHPYKSAAPTV